MANDPAMLLYTADFLVGVSFMSMAERGQYITLLCLQHQKGHLSIDDMEIVTGKLTDRVLQHFEQDEKGLYYNRRAEEEASKRQAYSESRRNNRKGKTYDNHMKNICSSYEKHMENENENINVNVNDNNSLDNKKGLRGEKKTFLKPTLQDVREYCQERHNGVNPDAFYNFYESKGWMVGRNHMKDWKACVRTWEQKRTEQQPKSGMMGPAIKGTGPLGIGEADIYD